MDDRNETLIPDLRALIAEEMFLLGQELDDSLTPEERRRLSELSVLLDEAVELLNGHRAARNRC